MMRDFERLAAESAGLLLVHVIGKGHLPALVRATLDGDVRAAQLVKSVLVSINNVESAPRHDPMPCGARQRPVKPRSRYAVGVALPDIDLPRRAMGFALCPQCCSSVATADAAALRAVRDVWPTAQSIVITHPTGGRA
jgi:hypothetical protein